MRNFKTEGIIIKRRDFKDADRILTVLTPNLGKIAVRASGIRRIPSRRSPHVELLNHCVLTLYNGRAFPILTEAQAIDSFSGVKEDLYKIGLAYHLCELIDGLCPENQENRGVFNLVKNTLMRLSSEENEAELIRNFQTELLSMLGYWNKQEFLTERVDMDNFVENILERKLKSKSIFAKLQ
ncbi:DNA repair protein RecO [Candidatus Roizmanbacteria bacterium]|nr:DNA repair protein RecO [Candidatus Roizmanbacteria bacterium]